MENPICERINVFWNPLWSPFLAPKTNSILDLRKLNFLRNYSILKTVSVCFWIQEVILFKNQFLDPETDSIQDLATESRSLCHSANKFCSEFSFQFWKPISFRTQLLDLETDFKGLVPSKSIFRYRSGINATNAFPGIHFEVNFSSPILPMKSITLVSKRN